MFTEQRSPRGGAWERFVVSSAWVFFLFAQTTFAQDWAPERRKDQFPTEPAYLVIPFPYSLPGIGSGIAFTGLLANIAEYQVDAYGIIVTGDVEGDAIGVNELYIIPETLFLDFEQFRASKAVINNYDERGMDTEKDDFNLIEYSDIDFRYAAATLTFLQRRIDIYLGIELGRIEITAIRDADGNVIADLRDDPIDEKTESTFAGAVLDFTDDRQDPRKGVRVEFQRSHSPRQTSDEPDYNVWDFSTSLYVPVGQLSTLLLNYYRSETEVLNEGNTNLDDIRDELGFDCDPGDQECLDAETDQINRTIAERRSGTASPLGGDGRLRSYPDGRYQGAYVVYYGAEFRWNLTEEVTPFDYFIWKDVRTGVQFAFFYETGSVADLRDELGDTYRSTYGAGIRMVSASGFVYRADFATGDEGSEFVFFFGYPF